jgi:hypothetical protein
MIPGLIPAANRPGLRLRRMMSRLAAHKNSLPPAASSVQLRLRRAASRPWGCSAWASAARGSEISRRLLPISPIFIAATLACLGYGYWLVYRRKTVTCADEAACSRPLPNRFLMFGLITATVLVAGAIAVDLLAPLILKS